MEVSATKPIDKTAFLYIYHYGGSVRTCYIYTCIYMHSTAVLTIATSDCAWGNRDYYSIVTITTSATMNLCRLMISTTVTPGKNGRPILKLKLKSLFRALGPSPRLMPRVTVFRALATLGRREEGLFAMVNNYNTIFPFLSASKQYVQEMFSLSQLLFISVYFILLLPHLWKTMNTDKPCSL